MKAIILAGGYATRLRPITYAIPKLLFPVLGKPMIYWTLDLLKTIRVEKVVLAVNYLADMLRAEVGTRCRGIDIEYSLETEPLGTGGPIKLASVTTRLDETFLVINGDVIVDIDLTKMMRFHEECDAWITDALHHVRDPARFGSAKIERGGRIKRFIEKPKSKENTSHLINAGIYIIEPKVLGLILPRRKVSLEREIFPILTREGNLYGFPFSGHWFDIGNFSDYRTANFTLLEEHSKRLTVSDKARVDKGAVIKPPLTLGDDSKVEIAASVGPRVVAGRQEQIETRARVSNSILFDGVTIGTDSVVSGSILASGVVLGKRVRIEPGSIVSPYAQIRDGIKIGKNAIIHPHKDIDSNVRAGAHVM